MATTVEYYIHPETVIMEDTGNFVRYAETTLPTIHTHTHEYFPTTVTMADTEAFDVPPPIYVHSDRSLVADVGTPIVVSGTADYINVDRVVDSVIPVERNPPTYSYHTTASGTVYAFATEGVPSKRSTPTFGTSARTSRAYHASPRIASSTSSSTGVSSGSASSTAAKLLKQVHSAPHAQHSQLHSLRGLTPTHGMGHSSSSHSAHGHSSHGHSSLSGHHMTSSRHHPSTSHLAAAAVGATQMHVSSSASSPTMVSSGHSLNISRSSHQSEHPPRPEFPSASLPAIPESDVQRLEYIGCGTNASVFTCLFDGAMACEKVLTSDDRDAQLQEAFMMAAVDRHPNVLRLYGLCRRSNGETSLVLELMQTDLLQKLQEYKMAPGFEPSRYVVQLIEFLIQAARGLRYLHRQGVVHRDVACRNMLISGNCLKLADFGLAKQRSSNRYTSDLPKPLSTAPEAIRDLDNPKVWSEKSDGWSYGLFMWEVLSFGEDPLAEFHNSVPALLSALNMGWKPVPIEHCPDVVWTLLLQCLSLMAEKRPSFDQILSTLTNAQMEYANSGSRHGAGGDPDLVVIGFR